jgi:site-specific DNA-cytosine methylase
MENVMPRLINAPWSEKLCAADFGDVTSRKRWFYSTHLLHVVSTPGPRRIRDIRDHDEDERVLRKRGYYPSAIVTHRPRTGSDGCEPYDTHVGDLDVFGSLTADAPRASSLERVTCKAGAHEHYGSIAINEASRLVGCRNPSLLEMARAQSIPDEFDWCGATKEQRGKMIANAWPVAMATAVDKAMLQAITSHRERANMSKDESAEFIYEWAMENVRPRLISEGAASPDTMGRE